MRCPACYKELTEKGVKDVKVDICENGCGGIWFDNFEIKKFDEPHESAGENLLDVKIDPSIKIDHSKKRTCPKCDDQKMIRHFFSAKREVEIDECPKCAGIWLDVGELAVIRKQFTTEDERMKAADKLFEDVFGVQLGAKAEERADKMDKASRYRVRGVLRFLCPSSYIKNKVLGD